MHCDLSTSPSVASRIGRAARIALALMITGCDHVQMPAPMFAVHVRPECPTTPAAMFFPDGLFESVPSGAAQSLRVRLSQTLGEMGEPSLSCGPTPDSYRFVWLQYHLHSPTTTVRVSKTANGWTAYAVRSSIEGRGITRYQAILNAEESQQMMNAVMRFGFWRRADFGDGAHLEDGSLWVIEGRQGTAYRAVVSAAEDEDGLRELARVFLRLTEMAPGANLR